MIKKVLLGLGAVIIALIIVASFKPDEFLVTRSVTISAPASHIYEHLNDLHKMNTWNPWIKMEPSAKMSYEGPASGVGAKYSWEGKEVGSGSMTIVETQPNQFVKTKLDFIKPMPGIASADFILSSAGKQTTLSWNMSGKNNLLGKIMCLFMNQDKMIGGTFEKGLADLKGMLESAKK